MKLGLLIRGSVAGVAGGVAWLTGLILIFGPAQAILSDPAFQSAKMLAAFGEGADPPRAATTPGLMIAGLMAIAILWGCVYAGISGSWQGSWLRRGAAFGGLAWALMVPWFEFYLPWNVLLEPAPLVLLEMLCWAAVLQGVGLAIAGVEALMRVRGAR
jgi:hypothetical protein